tara:strand:+ start:199 stop:375 length:177 start_codon:yes stop_codon:yes gene_type:complete
MPRKPKTLQDVIDNDIEITEELLEDMKLNWCLNDAVEYIKKHSKEQFIKKLEERLEEK